MNPAARDRNYRWKIVGLLFSIAALNYGDRTAISAVFPLIRDDLRMTDVGLAAVGFFASPRLRGEGKINVPQTI